MPKVAIFSATTETIFEAAKGVAFFGPTNPSEPAEAQVSTFPFMSVTVIIVLL